MSSPYWPVQLPIEDDELLSSWLIRTSLENGSDPLTWTWILWEGWRAWTRDFDRFCEVSRLKQISFGSFDIGQLQNATLFPSLEKIVDTNKLKHKVAWPWVIPLGTRNTDRSGGLRYCPECLKEGLPYFRKSWRLAWNHSCAKHHLLLVDHCPKCSLAITPHKVNQNNASIVHCPRCRLNLCQVTTKAANLNSIGLQNLLNKALSNEHKHELPWGMNSIQELFATTRLLMSFLQKISLPQHKSSASNIIRDHLQIPINPISNKNLNSIEKASPGWVSILSQGIYALYQMDLDEVIVFFQNANLYKSNLIALTTSPTETISFIGSKLISNTMKPNIKKHNKVPIEPVSQSEVWSMWQEIQRCLK